MQLNAVQQNRFIEQGQRFEQVAASMVVFAVEWAGRICSTYVQAVIRVQSLDE
jgi:hypothetical protein